MSKRKKAVLAVGLVLAVFLIGAIIFYMHFIMNAGQTIENCKSWWQEMAMRLQRIAR